jgi:hypothetical protein
MYPHRINQDGTIDSICTRCYATVGTSKTEDDLKRMETAHVCESGRLRYYKEQRKRLKRPPHTKSLQKVALPFEDL